MSLVKPVSGSDIKVRKNKRYAWSDMKEGDVIESKSPIITTARSWAKNNMPDWEFAGTQKNGVYIVKRVA